MSDSKKLTNAQLRDMTRDFFTQNITSIEQDTQEQGGLLNESMEELPPPGADRRPTTSTDAIILVEDFIQTAVFDGLEELGLDEQGADEIVRQLYNRPDMLKKALADGLYDYKRKLGMTGRPKPRSI